MFRRTVSSPLGSLVLTANHDQITAVDWGSGGSDTSDLLREAERQLEAYFSGDVRTFDLPLDMQGDALQLGVWSCMRAIPFGETREYGEIAKDLGAVPQAVGVACGRNRLPILIPCHRVVGKGHLGGFSAPGGVETKVALLRHEGAFSLLI